jgi:hypothetical protein
MQEQFLLLVIVKAFGLNGERDYITRISGKY